MPHPEKRSTFETFLYLPSTWSRPPSRDRDLCLLSLPWPLLSKFVVMAESGLCRTRCRTERDFSRSPFDFFTPSISSTTLYTKPYWSSLLKIRKKNEKEKFEKFSGCKYLDHFVPIASELEHKALYGEIIGQSSFFNRLPNPVNRYHGTSSADACRAVE